MGVLAVALLRMLATLMRVLAAASRGLAQVLIQAYDLIVFLPLAAERGLRHAGARRSRDASGTAGGGS